MARSVTDQIQTAIRRSGLTRYRISQMSGVSEAVLSKLKTGKLGAVTLPTAEALAKALGFELVLRPVKSGKRPATPASPTPAARRTSTTTTATTKRAKRGAGGGA